MKKIDVKVNPGININRRKFFRNFMVTGSAVFIPFLGISMEKTNYLDYFGSSSKNLSNDPPVQKKDPLKFIDISEETGRHVIISQGTEDIYQGHADTVLMADGKTMFCVWTLNHGWGEPFMKRSDDAGKTWVEISVPENWNFWNEVISRPGSTTGKRGRGWLPMIHRLRDKKGLERLFIFDRGKDDMMIQSVSEDGGKTWSAMNYNGLRCCEPPMNILADNNKKKYMMCYSDWNPGIYQAVSYDGGLTWGKERDILDTSVVPGVKMIEPGVVRSPDGRQLLMLIRDFESGRQYNSLYSISNNEGKNWTTPRRLHSSLTGDRHSPLYAPDGRLVIAMRDTLPNSCTYGHFIAWIGTYKDITEGRNGQYCVKLLHSYAGRDCGYPSLNLLPDGTIIATTYIQYKPGRIKHSVISTRFNLNELDKMASNL